MAWKVKTSAVLIAFGIGLGVVLQRTFADWMKPGGFNWPRVVIGLLTVAGLWLAIWASGKSRTLDGE